VSLAGGALGLPFEPKSYYRRSFLLKVWLTSAREGKRVSRATWLVTILAIGFLLPAGIPNVGLDPTYFFIMVIVLFAWFLLEWEKVRSLPMKSDWYEIALGLTAIIAIYAFKAFRATSFGILDMLIVLLGAVTLTFGLRALKSFWVPVAYGVVLLAGYQIEGLLPNYSALQGWLAGVMTSAVNLLGIGATVSGQIVTMNLPNGIPITLEVSSACTGLQGILAFGMLSTMALLDMKPRASRLVPIFAIGFIGAFLINIVRLLVVFLTFEYFGISAGETMHVYFGYLIFLVWVLAFWALAFKYLVPTHPVPAKIIAGAKAPPGPSGL
jgi:exosortase